MASAACDDPLKIYAWDNEWCAASRAGAVRRSPMRARSSCVCTRAQHHSLSRRMSSRAAQRALQRAYAHWRGPARVCAQAGTRYWTRDARSARHRSAILEHASHVLGSRFRPGQNRPGSQPGIVTPRRDRGRSGAGRGR